MVLTPWSRLAPSCAGEAQARAAAEAADLKKLRQEGFPNPRAEARLRELLALIEKRRSSPGSVLPVTAKPAAPARKLTLVFVSKYMGAPGTQFHRQTCDKLYGIVSAIDLPSAVKRFEACPSCAAGLSVKVAAVAEDLRAPTRAAEERERAALAAAQAERERERSASASSGGSGGGSSSGSSESSEGDAEVEKIKQTIRKHCERAFPDDFALRAACERLQNKGVQELAQGKPDDVSEADWATICNKAAENFPDDYALQAASRRLQLKGLRELR